MRPSLLSDTLKSLVNINRPVLIEGPPGLGKTQLPRQVAADMGIAFAQIHAPLMQPEDYGMPVVNAARDGVRFVVPTEKFPVVGSDWPERGVFLIDELPQADNSGQKILANLVQEREIHGQKLMPGWSIVATGNRASDRAGANRLLSHLRARVSTLEFEPHLDDWCAWALDHGVRTELVAFLRFRPNLLCDFDPHRDINPTPRSWTEGVSPVIDNVPPEAEFDCYKGAVGEGGAAEFVGFLKIFRKLPNPDVVLLSPDKHEVPTDPATLYALSGALAARSSQANFERVMTFAKRMPPEFMVLVVRDSLKRDRSVQQTKAFIDWASKEGSKVLM
jgi:hypothetical protein